MSTPAAEAPKADEVQDPELIPLDEFIAMHSSKIAEMRELLKDELAAVEQNEDVVGDIRILRFLNGFKFDVPAAADAMRAMLVWRKENGIDAVHRRVVENPDWTTFPHWADIGKWYPCSFHFTDDKDGRPVWIAHLGRVRVQALMDHVGLEKFVVLFQHVMEFVMLKLHEVSLKRNRFTRMIAIRDLSEVGMHLLSRRARELFGHIISETQNYYPETVHRNFFVNIPWIGYACFRVVKPTLAERTLHKLVFLAGDPSEELLKQIDAEQLPTIYGGRNEAPLFPLFAGEENRTLPVRVERSSSQFVRVSLNAGDVAVVGMRCNGHDVGVSTRFLPGIQLGLPRHRASTRMSVPPTPAGADTPKEGAAAPAPPVTPTPSTGSDVSVAESAPEGWGGLAVMAEETRTQLWNQRLEAPADGTIILCLDNSFSWVRGKDVELSIDVVPAATAQATGDGAAE